MLNSMGQRVLPALAILTLLWLAVFGPGLFIQHCLTMPMRLTRKRAAKFWCGTIGLPCTKTGSAIWKKRRFPTGALRWGLKCSG